ncbi:hypothetical protein D514_0107880 [Microbacterium sp. UCD-TDU]|nr:hypothetical protein D514_0107880 [Microbacterium sp. UCD-TDU]
MLYRGQIWSRPIEIPQIAWTTPEKVVVVEALRWTIPEQSSAKAREANDAVADHRVIRAERGRDFDEGVELLLDLSHQGFVV